MAEPAATTPSTPEMAIGQQQSKDKPDKKDTRSVSYADPHYVKCKSVLAGHQDLINDVAFDFYGKRMATCSNDQSVKVWDLGPDEEWHCTTSWKTQGGAIWKVCWAHPEFGEVLATCSFDRSCTIWQELADGLATDSNSSKSQWLKRAVIVDARTAITDLTFCPKHLGLQLAVASADGTIRIYEAQDVENLTQWHLFQEFHTRMACSSISWHQSRHHEPMIAVGSNDESPNFSKVAKFQVYEYISSLMKWSQIEFKSQVFDVVHCVEFAPNPGRSFELLAVASTNVHLFAIKRNVKAATGIPTHKLFLAGELLHPDSQVWRVAFNVTGTEMATSTEDGCVKIWKENPFKVWLCVGNFKPSEVIGETPTTRSSSSNASLVRFQ